MACEHDIAKQKTWERCIKTLEDMDVRLTPDALDIALEHWDSLPDEHVAKRPLAAVLCGLSAVVGVIAEHKLTLKGEGK